jgi:hypothetical protein
LAIIVGLAGLGVTATIVTATPGHGFTAVQHWRGVLDSIDVKNEIDDHELELRTKGLQQLLAADLASDAEAQQQAIEDAAGSDRHLELLAAELAKGAEARQQAIEDEAVRTAIRFIEARDQWDGESVRSLVADDAVIDDFAVATAEDYLANAEFERITEWRFLQPQCAATEVDPPVEVTCAYVMQNALSEALGVGPYTGTSIEFVIEDGQIRHVTHHFDYSQYSVQAFEVFTRWLVDAHPGDIDVMLDTADDGSAMRSTTPESLALWAQRIPEFVASLSPPKNTRG